VHCSLQIDIGDLEFVKEFKTAVYRIMQEALTNINRHAEATQSWVDFVIDDHHLVLQIRDNGKGLDPEVALQSKSLGLFGMRERVRSWGGDFKLSSTPGKGSIIRIAFNEDCMTLLQLPVNE
jgi:signal transduction histidine kinase